MNDKQVEEIIKEWNKKFIDRNYDVNEDLVYKEFSCCSNSSNQADEMEDWLRTTLHQAFAERDMEIVENRLMRVDENGKIEIIECEKCKQVKNEILEEIEKKSYPPHDLKMSLNPCTFYTNHEPVWDGNYYTCAKCGQEFIKAKEINKALSNLKALLTKDSKGE